MNPEDKMVWVTFSSSRSGGGIAPGQEDNDWPDRNPEYVDFDPEGVVSKNPDSFEAEGVEVDFNVPASGKEVFLVWVRYGTGDTFGHTDGEWTIIGVLEDKNKAEALVDSIIDDTYTGYKCWDGYFENFESAHCRKFVIDNNFEILRTR